VSARSARVESWHELAPPRPRGIGPIAGIVVRHAVPIVGLLAFDWSATQFLLLTVFNFGLTIGNVGLAGVAAAQLRGEDGSGPGTIGIGQLANLLAVTAFIALLLTALGGWPIFVISGVETEVLREPALWWSALGMELAAAPGLWAEIRDKAHSSLAIEQLGARDQPRVGAALLGVAASAILSAWAAKMGGLGMVFLVIAFTAFGLVRELRPDWIHQGLDPAMGASGRRERGQRG
jgi:hypothetical protein